MNGTTPYLQFSALKMAFFILFCTWGAPQSLKAMEKLSSNSGVTLANLKMLVFKAKPSYGSELGEYSYIKFLCGILPSLFYRKQTCLVLMSCRDNQKLLLSFYSSSESSKVPVGCTCNFMASNNAGCLLVALQILLNVYF